MMEQESSFFKRLFSFGSKRQNTQQALAVNMQKIQEMIMEMAKERKENMMKQPTDRTIRQNEITLSLETLRSRAYRRSTVRTVWKVSSC